MANWMANWWVLLAALLLAGCSTPDPTTQPQAGPAVLFTEGDTANGTGGLVGVVVDEAIRPIPGANVSIGNIGHRLAAEDGSFSFVGLAAGSYAFAVEATGFLPEKGQVDIAAGAVAQLRVLMQAEAVLEPYNLTLKFDGFAQLTAAGPDGATAQILLGLLGVHGCDRCEFTFSNDDGLHGLVLEATMSPNSFGSNGFGFLLQGAGGYAAIATERPNPMTFWFPFDEPVEAGSFQVRMYPYSEPAPELNKQFQVLVTLFYHAPPPEDFSALPNA